MRIIAAIFVILLGALSLHGDAGAWTHGSVGCGSGTFLVTASSDCSNILETGTGDRLTAN